MENTEEKIMLENDTFALRRDYKRALEQLTATKAETAEILAILEKAKNEYEAKQEDLRKVVNDISQEKLDWAQHRHAELMEIENKMSEAQNVLKRKAELNEQEQLLRDIEARTTEKLNEQKSLELQHQQAVKLLEAERKQFAEDKKNLADKKQKLEDNKKQFKLELTNFVQAWQTKL